MKRPVIAFGVNNTLTTARRPVGDDLCRAIATLLKTCDVCILSADTFEQIKQIFLSQINLTPAQKQRLSILPTSGAQLYQYDTASRQWQLRHSEELDASDRLQIADTLEEVARSLDIWPKRAHGVVIEDRGSQITFAALGMNASASQKYRWAEANVSKRQQFLRKITKKFPEFDVRLSGMTSLDVRLPGQRNHSVLMNSLEQANLLNRPMVYIGNSRSVDLVAAAFSSRKVHMIAVESPEDTRFVVAGILAAAKTE